MSEYANGWVCAFVLVFELEEAVGTRNCLLDVFAEGSLFVNLEGYSLSLRDLGLFSSI